MRRQNAEQIVLFISATTSRVGGTNSKTLKPFRASKGSEGPDANTFELLLLKHDRAYVNVELEKSMSMIWK